MIKAIWRLISGFCASSRSRQLSALFALMPVLFSKIPLGGLSVVMGMPLFLLFIVCSGGCSKDAPVSGGRAFLTASNLFLDNERSIDLYCMRAAYPSIAAIEHDNGNILLVLKNGEKLAYEAEAALPHAYSIREAMRNVYPLEPERPLPEVGESPGRKRPYDFFQAVYGATPEAVSRSLEKARILDGSVRMAPAAAEKLNRLDAYFNRLAQQSPQYAKLLKADGGYYWRNIAGEGALSAHSFGIAVDLGAKYAPYWRWARVQPHPAQKTYPGEIVAAMEDQGFIWGGKWHEYDLMHYEYRPELVCKSRMMRLTGLDGKHEIPLN